MRCKARARVPAGLRIVLRRSNHRHDFRVNTPTTAAAQAILSATLIRIVGSGTHLFLRTGEARLTHRERYLIAGPLSRLVYVTRWPA
jgi:hypothetical protein